jgi:acyl-CoA thioester hydrolase
VGDNAIRIGVRYDDLDTNGHVQGAAYIAYADHARWELVRSAGATLDALVANGLGPVNLETTVQFRDELCAGDETDVSCVFAWGNGKTYRIQQELHRSDGRLAAEVASVCGILDLSTRRLIADPAAAWRQVVTQPALLGL